MAYQTTNPYTAEVVATFADLEDSTVDQLLAQADRTYQIWSELPYAERAIIVKRAASILREQKEEYARLLTLEMGKLISQSRAEVELSASILDYYADNAEKFLAPEYLETEGPGKAMVVSEPLGILLGVQPWNFPYYQLARFAGPNVMAGNVVMVKHSSNVPQSAAAFERMFLEAGAPEGLYTNLYATKEQINRLIDDPLIQGVALTGSEGAGAIVAARAGKNLKKSTMELGGSDALVVLEDADMDKTVEWALWGRINNGGQCCVAAKRVICVESVAEEFLEKYKAAMAELVAGDPFDENTTLPPMSSQGSADELNEQVRTAVEGGATAIPLGQPVPEQGAFVQPTVLTNVTRENPVYDQEFFGPITMFFVARDEEDAVRIANDSSFGLGGSVFTQDIDRGVAFAKRIKTGMMFINHPTWTQCDLPFGGIKRSGYGRELSAHGIHEFVNKKLINIVPIDAPE